MFALICIGFAERLNERRLRRCVGPHDFHRDGRRGHKCRKCGGLVMGPEAFWYRVGLEHGRQHHAAQNAE
jgi:hypothetical protein